MLKYLLDANGIVHFQKGNCLDALVDAAKIVPMAIVSDVFDELTGTDQPEEPRTKWMKDAADALSSGPIEVIRVQVLSNEDAARTTFIRLMNPNAKTTTRNRGEAASAAIALHRPELIFVSEDSRAVHGRIKLYRELPGETGRIMGLHAFLRILVEKNTLSSTQAKFIAEARPLEHPLWWSNWLTGLAIPS